MPDVETELLQTERQRALQKAVGSLTVRQYEFLLLRAAGLKLREIAPAVAVASRFERDAVVTGVEIIVVDEDVRAGFGIAAVVVGAVAGDLDVAHRGVAREHGVDLPHR